MRGLTIAIALTLGLLCVVAGPARAQEPPAKTAPESREAVAKALIEAITKNDAAAFRARCTEKFLAALPVPLDELFGQVVEQIKEQGVPPVEEVAKDLRQQQDGRWMLDLPDEAVEEMAHARRAAQEAAAIGALKTIVTAQVLFREGDKDGNGAADYAADLKALGAAQLVGATLVTGEKQGYRFEVARSKEAPERQWMATAAPIDSAAGAARCYVTNEAGVIYEGRTPFALTADCKIPEGAVVARRPDDQEPDAPPMPQAPEPSPGAPDDLLAHVEVGQRWVFALQGTMQMVWRVTEVEKVGRVRYSMTLLVDGKEIGNPQPAEWVYTGPTVAPPADAQNSEVTTAREPFVVGATKLESLLTKVGPMTSRVAVKGDDPTFPGVIEAAMGGEQQLKLVRVDGP